MVKLVLFDIDGTLLHTGGAGRKAFKEAMSTAFRVPNSTDGVQFAGRTDTSLIRELFRKHNIDHTPQNIEHFFGAYYFWLDYILEEDRGVRCPYVPEFIQALRNLPSPPILGLLTGNVRLGAEIKLRHHSLWHEFTTGGFGDDNEDRNQIAAIAQKRGADLLGETLRGEEVLVIGDTPLDIACARAISAKCLAVATGNSSVEELSQLNPAWTVASLQNASVDLVCGIPDRAGRA